MHRPDHLVGVRHAFDQLANRLGILLRNVVADGIRHIDRRRTGLDHLIENADQEIDFRAPGIFSREFDIVGVFTRPADRLDRLLNHLIGRHAQLLFHVDRRSRDEGMDTPGLGRLDRLAGAANVVLVGARQRADGRILDDLGNRLDGIEIARRSGGKARLDHIDPHFFQLAGNADLFFLGHRCAGALFAVAQGGVKNYQMLLVHELLRVVTAPCA